MQMPLSVHVRSIYAIILIVILFVNIDTILGFSTVLADISLNTDNFSFLTIVKNITSDKNICGINLNAKFNDPGKEVANSNISDPRVNPDFRIQLQKALDSIPKDGIKIKFKNYKDGKEDIIAFPKVMEIYRSPDRSDYLKETGKTKAGAYQSAHNFGVGVDIFLYDKKGNLIDVNSPIYNANLMNKITGEPILNKNGKPIKSGAWYVAVKELVKYMTAQNLTWLENDSPHFEYHPQFAGSLGAKKLSEEKLKAINDAKKNGKSGDNLSDWLPYFWNNAGACKNDPHILKNSTLGVNSTNNMYPNLIPKFKDCNPQNFDYDVKEFLKCASFNAGQVLTG
jgi:hypothetical protein